MISKFEVIFLLCVFLRNGIGGKEVKLIANQRSEVCPIGIVYREGCRLCYCLADVSEPERIKCESRYSDDEECKSVSLRAHCNPERLLYDYRRECEGGCSCNEARNVTTCENLPCDNALLSFLGYYGEADGADSAESDVIPQESMSKIPSRIRFYGRRLRREEKSEVTPAATDVNKTEHTNTDEEMTTSGIDPPEETKTPRSVVRFNDKTTPSTPGTATGDKTASEDSTVKETPSAVNTADSFTNQSTPTTTTDSDETSGTESTKDEDNDTESTTKVLGDTEYTKEEVEGMELDMGEAKDPEFDLEAGKDPQLNMNVANDDEMTTEEVNDTESITYDDAEYTIDDCEDFNSTADEDNDTETTSEEPGTESTDEDEEYDESDCDDEDEINPVRSTTKEDHKTPLNRVDQQCPRGIFHRVGCRVCYCFNRINESKPARFCSQDFDYEMCQELAPKVHCEEKYLLYDYDYSCEGACTCDRQKPPEETATTCAYLPCNNRVLRQGGYYS